MAESASAVSFASPPAVFVAEEASPLASAGLFLIEKVKKEKKGLRHMGHLSWCRERRHSTQRAQCLKALAPVSLAIYLFVAIYLSLFIYLCLAVAERALPTGVENDVFRRSHTHQTLGLYGGLSAVYAKHGSQLLRLSQACAVSARDDFCMD